MLDRKFIVENAELVKQNCVNRGVKVDVDRFVATRRDAARPCKSKSRSSIARPTRSPSRSARPRTRPSARPARKKAGSSASKTRPSQTELDAMAAELDAIHRQIPNLSHPDAPVGVDDKSNLELFRGKTPLPKFDFQPLDHVAAGREARSGGFRGRGQRGRPRLLLPQERGRAAGAGLAALRGRRADGARASRRSPRPTWPATTCWPASASFPAGRKRKSTASRTPT